MKYCNPHILSNKTIMDILAYERQLNINAVPLIGRKYYIEDINMFEEEYKNKICGQADEYYIMFRLYGIDIYTKFLERIIP